MVFERLTKLSMLGVPAAAEGTRGRAAGAQPEARAEEPGGESLVRVVLVTLMVRELAWLAS